MLTQVQAEEMIAACKHIEDVVFVPVWLDGNTAAVRYVVLGAPLDQKLIFSIERTDIPGKPLLAVTFQLRHEHGEVLLRLDFGPSHPNPGRVIIGSPHLHRYREGWGDAWATPWEGKPLRSADDLLVVTKSFLYVCGIWAEIEGGFL